MFQELRKALLELSLPLQRFLQIFTLPERAGCASWVREIEQDLLPGDIFVCRTKYHLTNLFIPGFYSHAAMYIGNGKFIEAVTAGVVETDIIDWVLNKDFIAHTRPLYVSVQERENAVKVAKTLLGKSYDFMFEYDPSGDKNKAFYCSEIPYFCYQNTAWQQTFTYRVTLGQLTVTPQDYRNACDRKKLYLLGEYS